MLAHRFLDPRQRCPWLRWRDHRDTHKNLNNALENYEKTNERIAENLREKKKEEEKKRNKELVLKEKFRQQLEKIESDSTQTESTDKNSIQNNR